MREVLQNGDQVAAAAASAATSSNTLFLRGAFLLGMSFVTAGLASRFFLEATRAAAIEGVKIAQLPS